MEPQARLRASLARYQVIRGGLFDELHAIPDYATENGRCIRANGACLPIGYDRGKDGGTVRQH